MKKLVNNPRNVVREMLEGLVDVTPSLALLADEDVVVRADLPVAAERPVAVLSGGGSGHEPAHAGYVGDGMLTAAIAGDVFTSPSCRRAQDHRGRPSGERRRPRRRGLASAALPIWTTARSARLTQARA